MKITRLTFKGQSVLKRTANQIASRFRDEKALLRIGRINDNTFFEDIVNYKGESEWVEIDSDRICTIWQIIKIRLTP